MLTFLLTLFLDCLVSELVILDADVFIELHPGLGVGGWVQSTEKRIL